MKTDRSPTSSVAPGRQIKSVGIMPPTKAARSPIRARRAGLVQRVYSPLHPENTLHRARDARSRRHRAPSASLFIFLLCGLTAAAVGTATAQERDDQAGRDGGDLNQEGRSRAARALVAVLAGAPSASAPTHSKSR